ncbi:regulatory protein RecX [uncultured Rikenella sp.]|uniref:regulatory protein RecX n=1 Tax=uncultured Rikenella sp. TaxID=368003 RepID=UPI002637880A|nr:regulatory protein RecX [uncultured Rikenella sp.]
MVYYGDEETGYKRVRKRRRPAEADYSQPAKSVERALESLMFSCAKSERCISDIRRSLYRWRMNEADYEPIIRRLVEEKFVDEERYARAYVRDKMNGSGWGRRKIEMGLKAKGIPKETIEEALRQIEPERQSDKLETMLRRRWLRERDKAKGRYELRNKLVRWAMGRGYDYSEIQDVLERMMEKDYDPGEEVTK